MKKVIFYITVIFFIFSLSVKAEDYYSLINQADNAFRSRDYSSAGELYGKAFKIGKNPRAMDFFFASMSFALSGNKDEAFDCLNKAIDMGFYYTDKIREMDVFSSLYKDKRWDEFILKLDRIEAGFNSPLKEELEKIYREDQKYRKDIDIIIAKYGMASPQMKELNEKMKTADMENLKKITEIIDKYGWPGKSLVGSKASQGAFLVIQHAELNIQEKYLPLLLESAKKGELDMDNLAILQDRILMRNGKKQIYGSQVMYDEKTKKYQVYPIEDEQNVDKLREEAGLMPLYLYLKQFGIDYNK